MEKLTIAERLKARRRELKLNQAALGKAVGVSHVAISQWERSETEPRGDNLLSLARALKCSAEYLLYGESINPVLVQAGNAEGATNAGPQSRDLTRRQEILLQLFDDLPDSEADELIRSLEDKKRHYDALYQELSRKRHGKAS